MNEYWFTNILNLSGTLMKYFWQFFYIYSEKYREDLDICPEQIKELLIKIKFIKIHNKIK